MFPGTVALQCHIDTMWQRGKQIHNEYIKKNLNKIFYLL
jgi:hypothetical protein